MLTKAKDAYGEFLEAGLYHTQFGLMEVTPKGKKLYQSEMICPIDGNKWKSWSVVPGEGMGTLNNGYCSEKCYKAACNGAEHKFSGTARE